MMRVIIDLKVCSTVAGWQASLGNCHVHVDQSNGLVLCPCIRLWKWSIIIKNINWSIFIAGGDNIVWRLSSSRYGQRPLYNTSSMVLMGHEMNIIINFKLVTGHWKEFLWNTANSYLVSSSLSLQGSTA